jgi:F-type H+-transporting ATPase subunit b
MLASASFWTAIGFLLLVGAIARPVARGVAASLDARAARIKGTLEEAARLREEAQHLLAEYQRRQRDAVKEAEEIVASAEMQARRLAEEATAKLEAALERRQQSALDKIAQAEAEALRHVHDTAVDVAMEAARRLIAERLDAARAGALIDGAIEELPTKLH